MDWLAQRRAAALRATLPFGAPLDDVRLDDLLEASGLRWEVGWPFAGRVREVYAAGTLGIRAGLSAEWVRWLKAHGLGHHLLHRGNHLYVRDGLHLWRQHEIEAELFAGSLLVGEAWPPGATMRDVAVAARVPVECVHSWQAARLLAAERAEGELSRGRAEEPGPAASAGDLDWLARFGAW